MDFKMTGLGSGFDIDSIVKAYVDAEKVPQEAMIKNKRAKLEAQLSAFGQLESQTALLDDTLQKLSDTSFYSTKNYQIATTEFFVPTVHSEAYASAHDIRIEKVAQAHMVASPSQVYLQYPADPLDPNIVPDSMSPEMALGAKGALTVKVDGMGQTVDVTEDMSLLDIAKAIDDVELDTPYVQTSLIFAATGTQLVFMSEAMGEEKMTIDLEDDDLAGNAILTQLFGDAQQLRPPLRPLPGDPPFVGLIGLKAGSDAELTIDGLRFQSQSNTLIDVIPGLDLEIKKAHGQMDDPTLIGIYVDQSALLDLLYTFVEQHNNLNAKIKEA